MSKGHKSQSLVLAGRFTSVMDAELACMQLAGGNINAVVFAETAGGWRPELAVSLGVEVRVAPQDLAAATRFLEAAAKSRKAGSP